VACSSGSCTQAIDAGIVDLAADLDESIKDYASVILWRVDVDGKEWRESPGVVAAPALVDEASAGALALHGVRRRSRTTGATSHGDG